MVKRNIVSLMATAIVFSVLIPWVHSVEFSGRAGSEDPKASKTDTLLSSAELNQQDRVSKEIDRLIDLNIKAAKTIRNDVESARAGKQSQLGNKDHKKALAFAKTMEDLAEYLKKNKSSLVKSSPRVEKPITDLTELITETRTRGKTGGDGRSSADKMGNFDVQELMSRATQANNLVSSIQKNLDKSNEMVRTPDAG
jgi:hypothetical protein